MYKNTKNFSFISAISVAAIPTQAQDFSVSYSNSSVPSSIPSTVAEADDFEDCDDTYEAPAETKEDSTGEDCDEYEDDVESSESSQAEPKKKEETVEPKKDETVEPKKEKSVEPKKEETVEPKKEETVEAKNEETVEPKNEEQNGGEEDPINSAAIGSLSAMALMFFLF